MTSENHPYRWLRRANPTKDDVGFCRKDEFSSLRIRRDEFRLDLEGDRVSSRDLVGAPALLVFYRGNWCPLCVTQVQDLARNYRALRERGIRVVLVSPQSPEHTASLAKRFDAPMEFWIDKGLAAARTLGILDAQGLPMGMEVLGYERDTVLPTSILVDERGVVFHDDQTDSYRIRPEPEDYLAAFDAWRGSTTNPAS